MQKLKKQKQDTHSIFNSLDYHDKALLYCTKEEILPCLKENIASKEINANQKTIQKLIALKLAWYDLKSETYNLTLRGRIMASRVEFSIPLEEYLSSHSDANRLYAGEGLSIIKEGSPAYDYRLMADFYERHSGDPTFPLYKLSVSYGDNANALTDYALAQTNLVAIYSWQDSTASIQPSEVILHTWVTGPGRKLLQERLIWPI